MDAGQVLQYDTPFNVITHPANDFVGELIGADDMMRLLRLVTVRNVLEPLAARHGPQYRRRGTVHRRLDARRAGQAAPFGARRAAGGRRERPAGRARCSLTDRARDACAGQPACSR